MGVGQLGTKSQHTCSGSRILTGDIYQGIKYKFWEDDFLRHLTPCLAVAVQPCMERIPIKKKKKSGRLKAHPRAVRRDNCTGGLRVFYLEKISGNAIFRTSMC